MVGTLKSIKGVQKCLIVGYHEAARQREMIYNQKTAEQAIQSASHAIFQTLGCMTDAQIIKSVRQIAKTLPP